MMKRLAPSGSILSWDDEEEGPTSSAGAAANGSSAEERDNLSSLPALPPSFNSYPQQIAIIAMQANNQRFRPKYRSSRFRIMVQNPHGFQTQQHSAYAQQAGQIQQMQMTVPTQNQQQAPQQAQQGQTYAVQFSAQQQQMIQNQQQQMANAVPAQNPNLVQQSQHQQQTQAQVNQQHQVQQQRLNQQQQAQRAAISQQQQAQQAAILSAAASAVIWQTVSGEWLTTRSIYCNLPATDVCQSNS
jgi:chemotaxis protein histidine kinase CheA